MRDIEELKNKVIQGDCLEVMKDIPDKSIDMILCFYPKFVNRLRDTFKTCIIFIK